jgi:hypothetical protein
MVAQRGGVIPEHFLFGCASSRKKMDPESHVYCHPDMGFRINFLSPQAAKRKFCGMTALVLEHHRRELAGEDTAALEAGHDPHRDP